MASSKKTTTTKKPAAQTKRPAKGRSSQPQSDIDERWSYVLFGVGILLVLLSVIPGESGWAWIRKNILFGTFGISGWLIGPFMIFVAVLIDLKKPVLGYVIKGLLFLFTLSGAALVFGKADFTNLQGQGIGEILKALLENGSSSFFGGGIVSLFLGYSIMAFTGRAAARALLVLLVLLAVMLFTGVKPGDIVRFVQQHFGKAQEKRATRRQVEYEQTELDDFVEEAPLVAPKPAPKKLFGGRKGDVDINLGPEEPKSEPGLGEHDEVVIGPGGTFGMNPLVEPEKHEAPIEPFDPFSSQSLFDDTQSGEAGNMLLFGEDDPYASLGGQDSVLPKANLFDVEYVPEAVPAPEPEFDLFGRSNPVTPVQFPKEEKNEGQLNIFADSEEVANPFLPKEKDIFDASASASADPTVAAMIDKAATKPEEGQPVGDTRQQDNFVPYSYPPVSLFSETPSDNNAGAREEMQKTADLLVGTLSSFGVQTRILDVSRGPSVTRYEIQPQAGVKISRITNLADDIALNLAAAGVRIEAPIPGKPAVGIEVPNKIKSMVGIRSILESPAFAASTSPLSIALGKDIAGDAVVADLTKMPHMLVAGSTGSGKSVCINATIMSFLYKSSPEDVRLLLIDPKVVELAEYNGIPHLLMPVVTEPRKAAGALGAMVAEMEKRYRLFAENNVRDIRTFNKLAQRMGDLEKLPYIAIVIDELADLMMTAGKEVEDYICRIAQKARAAGMHLIVATQRPSVDVITGLIKANIPSRIAFAVSSQIDSRTILDGAGAEKLLGMGDMLFMPVGANKPVRVQGTYVKDGEISAVLKFIKKDGDAQYDEGLIAEMERCATPESGGDSGGDDGENMLTDPTFISAVEIALENGSISTSFLQRRLRLGYARAGRMMDEMERLHIVSPPEGSKPRQVLISRQQWLEMSMNNTDESQG